jgi:hypothetical protein
VEAYQKALQALRKEGRVVDLPLGSEVELIKEDEAAGAVEVRVTKGPKVGRVAWIPRHVLVAPDGQGRIKAAQAPRATERSIEPPPRVEARIAGAVAPREPRDAKVLCSRFNARSPVPMAAPHKDGWDLLQEWIRGRSGRKKLMGFFTGGTQVQVVREGVAAGAVEVRVTNGANKGCVGWVDARDVSTPAGYDRGLEEAAKRAEKYQEQTKDVVTRKVARRKFRDWVYAKRIARQQEAARVAAAEERDFQLKLAPVLAQEQRLRLEQAQVDIAKQNANNYSRDVNYRAMYLYGAPITVGPGGQPVPYGSQ